MDKMYEEEVEGIIVRSRARWHEHGEKNSRYFLNLEKLNHVKKHVRKFRLSGVITSDPFEILHAEKDFYESLYKSHRAYVQPTEASLNNYDDLPIPKLSEDYRQFGEGVITLDECLKVLNHFPLNKTPGNDGLPIEFYQTVWNSVGEHLMESFNESFINSAGHRHFCLYGFLQHDWSRQNQNKEIWPRGTGSTQTLCTEM